jgi:hypothetical protein
MRTKQGKKSHQKYEIPVVLKNFRQRIAQQSQKVSTFQIKIKVNKPKYQRYAEQRDSVCIQFILACDIPRRRYICNHAKPSHHPVILEKEWVRLSICESEVCK